MSACILWLGAINNKGYGVRTVDMKNVLAHRHAFKIANPRLKIEGSMVLHKCDTRLCVNSEHLRRGTAQDNTDDMMKKGRWIEPRRHHGRDHSNARLTPAAVSEIRRKHRPGKWGATALAKKYGVCRQTITNVVAGRTQY